ncbi:MAG: PDZ domain-containing protein [Myxococcales bacterium]|nr:PDZ domain-containing protein [Myxococcales bacterium]
MPKILRRLLAIALLVGAWALAGNDRAPIPVTINEAVAGPAARWEPPGEGLRPERSPHDLSALRVFTKVILYVRDNYVDPKRVKPKEMMIAALEYVEKTVPDVMVEGNAETGKLKLNVNGKVREFEIGHVDSLWKMSFTLKDVFDHIVKHMRKVEDTRDIEYAAVNGMLSTLDPHSVLLRPEVYREMRLTTKGEFGGLGFVIQMKEGNLTVVKVLPKTPAYRAGIKKDDQIRKIGEESTVNMDLNEAVSKLRGPENSKVTITVERKGWDKPQVMTLTRALINIESVQAKLLASNVAYVRLKNFQGNTTRHLQQTIEQLSFEAQKKGGPLKGLVLDLRGNPGGLLEQAIQVSDLFLSQGTIVSTVGYSDKLREEKKAHFDESDLAYPMVVLVNAGSASASEIVAGSLKNLNRAVVIGRQTFGKGSVQVLYDNFPEEAALKLTIAKYLTPGDVSIQEIGIVPDIELIPTRVTSERVDVFAPRRSLGEADLDHHFGNPSSAQAAKKRDEIVNRVKPAETLKYLKEEEKLETALKPPKAPDAKKKPSEKHPLLDLESPGADDLDDQLDAEVQDEVKEDFEVLLARDFVLGSPFTERDKMLAAGRSFVEQKRAEEELRIAGAISGLGIDWSPGPTPKGVQLGPSLKPGPLAKLAAGEAVQLELSVENRGAEPVHRLRAWTESENFFLDRREFVFGALLPGEKKSWTVPVKLPKDLVSRRDDVTVKFFDDGGQLPDTLVSELNFAELPRPAFSFGYQVLDGCESCNGDGSVQRGEQLELLLDVTNTGSGKALDSFAQIKNAADQNIFIEKGRFKLGELAVGETKTARFVLEVKKPYREATFALKLAIIDEPLEEYTSEKLEIPIEDEPLPIEPLKGLVRAVERAELYPSPTSTSPIARLPKGAVFTQLARVGPKLKVEWTKERFAFLDGEDAREVRGARPVPPKEVEHLSLRIPPQITLSVDPSQGGLVADGDRFALSGVVTNPRKMVDLYVLVNDQKVFFKGSDGEPKLRFSTEFPLKEGNNNVLVVARESQEFGSRRSLVVRRRPEAVAQKMGKLEPKQ